MNYVPQWKNGKEVGTGRRAGAARYEPIRNYLRDFGMPPGTHFTALDFGAFGGYFAQRLSEDFDVAVVAVEGTRGGLADVRGNRNVKAITAFLNPDQVKRLGKFDVVLCLSVLHHIPNWREMLNTLVDAGTVVFIEVASPGENLPKAVAHKDSRAIMDAVTDLSTGQIAETPGHDASLSRPIFVIDHRVENEAIVDDIVEKFTPAEKPKGRPRRKSKVDDSESVPLADAETADEPPQIVGGFSFGDDDSTPGEPLPPE